MNENDDHLKDGNKENPADLSGMLKKYSESYGADAMGGDLGLKGIRQSPSWYLTSDTVEGAIQARTELLQNAVDESAEIMQFFLGSGIPLTEVPDFEVNMKIGKDDTFTISDTGRGVPADFHEKFKRPTIEVAFEELNIGAKGKGFVQQGKSAYKTKTIGKHGSGAACANATSDFLEVISYVMKDNKVYTVRWEEAVKTHPTREIGSANGRHGTTISFRPSREVFRLFNGKGEKLERFYDEASLVSMLKEYAFNTDGIKFRLEYEQPDGTFSLTEIHSKDYDPTSRLQNTVVGEVHSTAIEDVEEDYDLKIYAGFSPSNPTTITTSNMLTLTKGTHTDLFKEVFDEIIYDVEKEINDRLTKKGYKQQVSARYLEKYGVYKPSGYVSVYGVIKMGNPQYTSQAKEELRVPHIIDSLRTTLTEKINTDFVGLKESVVKFLSDRGFNNIEANIQNDKLKEMKKKREENKKELNEILNNDDPNYVRGMGKGEENIKYARTRKAQDTIVFFLEGGTAASQFEKIRDIETHTIVNLDQRPPNVYNHKPAKLRSMEKYKMLYRLLYGTKDGNLKAIVLAPDNDADGELIRAYLLAFIYMFFPHYLTQGRVFILETPKYAAISASNDIKDFLTEEDRTEFLNTERENTRNGLQEDKGWTTAQYKGLGSIPRDVLKNLVHGGSGFVRINPDTIEEGMVIIEQMLSDTAYKKHHVLTNYSTESLKDHMYARQEIIRQQEVDYDIHNLGIQFNDKPDLTEIKTETNLEKIIREQMEQTSLTEEQLRESLDDDDLSEEDNLI